MRIPTTAMIGNLRFTRTGTVWADFLLSGVPYGLRPVKEKLMVKQLHQGLFRALPGESLLLGLVSTVDPAQLVARMLAGVDPEECPDWVAECDATWDSLEQLHPGQRLYWLSLPLAEASPIGQVGGAAAAVFADLKERVGLPKTVPSQARVDALLAQARKAVESVPRPFHATPATPALMVWLHSHLLDRGLYQDWTLPDGQHDDVTAALNTSKSGTALTAPFLDEGGQTDMGKKASWNPLGRRFVKVQNPAVGVVEEASYQSLLVVSDVPDGGMLFPGSEVIGRIDECGLDVDWAVRLQVRASAEVALSNQKALRNLNEQFSQRDGEASHGLSALAKSAEDLAEYAALLEADKLEVETQATIIFCVAGPTAESAMLQAKGLADFLSEAGYKLAQPVGFQEELWWAMCPGVPAGRLVREYGQITTSASLSATVPLASTRLGDQQGSLLGLNIGNGPLLAPQVTCGPTGVIFHDPEGSTDRNVSGSIAITGELGSGKSFTLKKIAADVIDRGGTIIVPDRTHMGEWALWADSVTTARVVDTLNPVWSLDPLRLFGAVDGSRIAQSFLIPLLNVAPTTKDGVLMSDVLDPDYLASHRLVSLGGLVTHLNTDCALEGAKDLGRLINVFARRDLGRVIFDATIPALDLAEQAVIILTHGLELPSSDELAQEHLFRQLSLEKLFGRALYALIASMARQVCFADLDRLAAFIVDEAHSVTISAEGTRAIQDFVRDGRKHRAIVALGSHDAEEDFPSTTLRGLIPTRLLMRHTDKALARRGLAWLDLDPDDEALVELVTKNMSPLIGDQVPEHRRGECLYRDSAGNVGRAKILAPATRARNQAARTGGRKDIA